MIWRRGRARLGGTARVLVLLLAWLAAGAAWGQGASGEPSSAELVETDAVPAIAAFGVQFGFPAYRTASVTASLQARFVGLSVRVGGGPGTLAVGAQARVYLPLPLPVPTFVGAGIDLFGGRLAPHVVVGVHLPVAERWRLDVEGGVAWAPLLDERRVVPQIGIGFSYALAVGLPPATPSGSGRAVSGGSDARCEAGPPDPGALDAAVSATVRRFLADAVATYGSAYRGLRYTTSVRVAALDGATATMIVTYEGSVIEILTGREIAASGEAEIDFRWGGCSWLRTSLRY